MNDSKQALGPIGPTGLPDAVKPAPLWALVYVGQMTMLCNYNHSFRVLVAPDAWFDDLTTGNGADGCWFNSRHGGDDALIIRESAVDSDHWRDVMAHEFAHALHGEIDRAFAEALLKLDALEVVAIENAYREAVEKFVPMLGGFIQIQLYERSEGDE